MCKLKINSISLMAMALAIVFLSMLPMCFSWAKEGDDMNIAVQETADAQYYNDGASFIQSINLGNGLVCEIYEIPTISAYASGTITKTHDFALYYSGTYFGYLEQTTSWTYDGTNRPTFNSASNTFYSTDTSKHYLTSESSTTSNYGTTSKQYNRKAKVYYNSSYIATTNFTTICDKNGNLSFACTDD